MNIDDRLGTSVWLLASAITGLAGCMDGASTRPEPDAAAELPTPSARRDPIGALAYDYPEGFFPFCTGVLISPTAVLTAEHCVDDPVAPEIFDGFFLTGEDVLDP